MEVSLSGQLLSFALAGLLGASLGVVYDVLSLLAQKLPATVIRVLFDIVFWLTTVLALIWYAMSVGAGALRIYNLFGIALGGILYFLLISTYFRRVGGLMLTGIFKILEILITPVVVLWRLLEKFWKILLDLFHFTKKCDILYQTADHNLRTRERLYRQGVGHEETQETRAFYRYRNRNLLRLRRHQLNQPTAADQRAEQLNSRAGGTAENRGERERSFTSSYRL